MDESASCKEDGPAQQHFLQMIRIVWMVQPVAKRIFGTTTPFWRIEQILLVVLELQRKVEILIFRKIYAGIRLQAFVNNLRKERNSAITHNLSCKVTKSCCKYFQSMDGTHLWGFQLQGLGDWSVTEARDRPIYLPLFKVLIVPLQTTWDGCYMKQILSKGLPWEGSTYLIRWSTIKTPPSFKMNQKHQSPWTVLAHILKIWADLNSTVTKISSTHFTHNLTVQGF